MSLRFSALLMACPRSRPFPSPSAAGDAAAVLSPYVFGAFAKKLSHRLVDVVEKNLSPSLLSASEFFLECRW
jgi:hypothetical protein